MTFLSIYRSDLQNVEVGHNVSELAKHVGKTLSKNFTQLAFVSSC